MFIIVYARIIDNKKDGLEMEGPFLGAETSTMEEAHQSCSDLVTESKNHTIVRIYDLSENSEKSALEKAAESFDKIYSDMQLALRIVDRPVIKRKRKKKESVNAPQKS